jgi:hypothetical protein
MVLLGDVGQVEAHFGPLGDSFNLSVRSVHCFCRMYLKHGNLWAHPMVLLGDVCQVEARLGPFGNSVNIGARQVHGLRRLYHRHGNLVWHNRW